MRREVYFLVLICVGQIKGYYEGDSCIINGRNGVCKNIDYCPPAIEDITNKKMPQICSFSGAHIVCCDIASVTTPPKISTTTDYVSDNYDSESEDEDDSEPTCPPIDPRLTAPRTGQKAWDKCIEYQEEYVYPCKRSYSLLAGLSRIYDCKHSAKEYIINGENAKPAEFPHMALLGYRPDSDGKIPFSCGGSVISERFILTAGHCIYAPHLGTVKYALLGTLRRSDKYHSGNLYSIKRIVKHPDYKPPMRYNDIALLETDRQIKLSTSVVPACLDVGNESVDRATATGWGATGTTGLNADSLQKVSLTKFHDLECFAWHTRGRHMSTGWDPRTQTCYGDKTQTNDTCGGDSGGPLQVHSSYMKCMYVVIGVTSFGKDCGYVGKPGVYTKVKAYLPWIESIVWP